LNWKCFRRFALIYIDHITDKPELKLFKLFLPPDFIITHPFPAGFVIRHVNYYLCEIVAVQNTLIPPMPFHLLRFIASRIEALYNLENCLREQGVRDITAIVKL